MKIALKGLIWVSKNYNYAFYRDNARKKGNKSEMYKKGLVT